MLSHQYDLTVACEKAARFVYQPNKSDLKESPFNNKQCLFIVFVQYGKSRLVAVCSTSLSFVNPRIYWVIGISGCERNERWSVKVDDQVKKRTKVDLSTVLKGKK